MDCCANLSKSLLEKQSFEIFLPDGDLTVSDLGRGFRSGRESCPSAQAALGCCVQLWIPRTAGTGDPGMAAGTEKSWNGSRDRRSWNGSRDSRRSWSGSRDRRSWSGARGGCRDEEGTEGNVQAREVGIKHQTKHQDNETLKFFSQLFLSIGLSQNLTKNNKKKKPYQNTEAN